jgi:hypothetical protein
MSSVHFLDAYEPYQQMIEGLNPDAKLHETYIDLEPVSPSALFYGNSYMLVNRSLEFTFKSFPENGINSEGSQTSTIQCYGSSQQRHANFCWCAVNNVSLPVGGGGIYRN